MTDLRTAAQAVDEAIFRKGYVNSKNRKDLVLIEALRQALAEPEPTVDALIADLGNLPRHIDHPEIDAIIDKYRSKK